MNRFLLTKKAVFAAFLVAAMAMPAFSQRKTGVLTVTVNVDAELRVYLRGEWTGDATRAVAGEETNLNVDLDFATSVGKVTKQSFVKPSLQGTNGRLRLNLPQSVYENAEIKLVNVSGRILKSAKLTSLEKEVNLSMGSIGAGVYFVMVKSKSGASFVQKFSHRGGNINIAAATGATALAKTNSRSATRAAGDEYQIRIVPDDKSEYEDSVLSVVINEGANTPRNVVLPPSLYAKMFNSNKPSDMLDGTAFGGNQNPSGGRAVRGLRAAIGDIYNADDPSINPNLAVTINYDLIAGIIANADKEYLFLNLDFQELKRQEYEESYPDPDRPQPPEPSPAEITVERTENSAIISAVVRDEDGSNPFRSENDDIVSTSVLQSVRDEQTGKTTVTGYKKDLYATTTFKYSDDLYEYARNYTADGMWTYVRIERNGENVEAVIYDLIDREQGGQPFRFERKIHFGSRGEYTFASNVQEGDGTPGSGVTSSSNLDMDVFESASKKLAIGLKEDLINGWIASTMSYFIPLYEFEGFKKITLTEDVHASNRHKGRITKDDDEDVDGLVYDFFTRNDIYNELADPNGGSKRRDFIEIPGVYIEKALVDDAQGNVFAPLTLKNPDIVDIITTATEVFNVETAFMEPDFVKDYVDNFFEDNFEE